MKFKIGDQVYDYEPNKLSLKEATQLKVQAGLGFSDILGGNIDDPRILTAIVWLARYRDGELKLRYDDVDLLLNEFEVVPDEEPAAADPTVATLPDDSSESPATSNVSNNA